MNFEIKVLDQTTESDYEALIQDSSSTMFNHSLQYKSFLQKILGEAESHYLLAYDSGNLVAALPVFFKQGFLGTVANSLPFYGSHGGLIEGGQHVSEEIRKQLLLAFSEECKKRDVICSTLVESPFTDNETLYADYKADFIDKRIGQITSLPAGDNLDEIQEELFKQYHQKTRNMVRKGMKSSFTIGHDESIETLKALHLLHDQNLRGIGGIAKSWDVFTAIHDVFDYGKDYRIYTAEKDGRIVSALLVFYFKGFVEYFTPATLEEYRSEQPLSLLIFTAMQDAVLERRAKYWNWGGTWVSQKGVYQFKSRWGTQDYPYQYHIKLYKGLAEWDGFAQQDLLDKYQYFYTVPFSELS